MMMMMITMLIMIGKANIFSNFNNMDTSNINKRCLLIIFVMTKERKIKRRKTIYTN